MYCLVEINDDGKIFLMKLNGNGVFTCKDKQGMYFWLVNFNGSL